MGAGEPAPSTLEAAGRLGRLVAEAGWAVLTGGGPAGGVEAASPGGQAGRGGLPIWGRPTPPRGAGRRAAGAAARPPPLAGGLPAPGVAGGVSPGGGP